MLTVTTAASARLAAMLVESGAPPDMAVRLVRDEFGIVLGHDAPRAGDTLFRHGARTVLLLDVGSAALLEDATLDAEGYNLTLVGPPDDEPFAE